MHRKRNAALTMLITAYLPISVMPVMPVVRYPLCFCASSCASCGPAPGAESSPGAPDVEQCLAGQDGSAIASARPPGRLQIAFRREQLPDGPGDGRLVDSSARMSTVELDGHRVGLSISSKDHMNQSIWK